MAFNAKQYRKEWYQRNKERHKANVNAAREVRRAVPEERAKDALKRSAYESNIRGYLPCTSPVREIAEALTGCCDICDTPETELTYRLSLDHCHTTGKFRGWLCDKCNRGLGCFNDNSDLLHNASAYLSR